MLWFFWGCLKRLYVVIICDGYIILDGILVIQNRFFLFLYVEEGTNAGVDSIDEDVWCSEDELTGDLSDEVGSWY